MSIARQSTAESHAPAPVAASRIRLSALALVLLALVAYHNSFSVPFIFDDLTSIVENPAIRHLGSSPADAVTPPGGLTTSGRPVVRASFALNYAWSGYLVRSYHVLNLLIHLSAGLVLFGLMRRTLLRPALRPRFGSAAWPLGWLVAALWTLHPLQTESVTYVVQRAESLAGLFCLLTLYAYVRGVEGRPDDDTPPARPAWGWLGVSVVACALGMGTKEVAVSAPLLVLLYDRTLVSGTFRTAWRQRWGFYLALGATWLVLAYLVVGTGSRGGTAGFGTEISSWSYALAQCRAIVVYAGLSLWPRTLVFDYGIALDHPLVDVLPQAVAIIALVTGVAYALRRPSAWGLAGAWFLALLAPSSSFIPVATQTMAEHRMYLPLLAILAVVVPRVYRLIGCRLYWWAGAAAVAFTVATAVRNGDYRSDATIWRDTARKRPTNARAHNNLGQALFREGGINESIACYERALQLQPNYAEPHYNLGVSLARLERLPPAIEHYEAALRLQPRYPEAHNNLGNVLVQTGRLPAAIGHYEQALAVKPDFAEAHNNLGNALLQSGRAREAVPSFQRALQLKPAYAEASYHLGNAYAASGAMKEALSSYQQALQLNPDYAEAHVNAGNALLALERPAEALAHYEKAVLLNPRLADAHFNLGSALLVLGRWSEAVPRFETTLRLEAGFIRARRALGFALAKIGRAADAVPHYEAYVRAVPDDAEAREELRQLRR